MVLHKTAYFRVGGITAASPASGGSPAVPVHAENVAFSDTANHGIPLIADPTITVTTDSNGLSLFPVNYTGFTHSSDATTYSSGGSTGWNGGAVDGLTINEPGMYAIRTYLKWSGSAGAGFDEIVSRLYVNGSIGGGTATTAAYTVVAESRSTQGIQTVSGTTYPQGVSSTFYSVVVPLAAGDQLIFEMTSGNSINQSNAIKNTNADSYSVYGADNALSGSGAGSTVFITKIDESNT